MKNSIHNQPAFLELRRLDLDTPEGRPLFRDLNLSVGKEQVAIIGRNGIGKSTLLAVLALPFTHKILLDD